MHQCHLLLLTLSPSDRLDVVLLVHPTIRCHLYPPPPPFLSLSFALSQGDVATVGTSRVPSLLLQVSSPPYPSCAQATSCDRQPRNHPCASGGCCQVHDTTSWRRHRLRCLTSHRQPPPLPDRLSDTNVGRWCCLRHYLCCPHDAAAAHNRCGLYATVGRCHCSIAVRNHPDGGCCPAPIIVEGDGSEMYTGTCTPLGFEAKLCSGHGFPRNGRKGLPLVYSWPFCLISEKMLMDDLFLDLAEDHLSITQENGSVDEQYQQNYGRKRHNHRHTIEQIQGLEE
ncbi:hypothetical protein ZIOFF_021321 [Zingiber officinale]|uniref:Uncharacterized protein n=1 Tax=Zingiber officinale TaxID=94328 RepID=A0A8J5LGD1_ZINOF|nr:hypothetical protein ZIOFF_021321 [Zingiber officinale]